MALLIDAIRDSVACERNATKRHRIDGYPCLVCGRPCSDNGKARWFYVHEGGAVIVTDAEYTALEVTQPGAGCGAYPVGPDCYRKHKTALAPYLAKES